MCKRSTGGFSTGGAGPALGEVLCHVNMPEEVGRRLAGQLVLQGAEVAFVDQYTYLGCVIDRSLSLDVMVADRAAKGRRALMALLPFLRNNAVPLHVRASVFVERAAGAPVMHARCRVVGWLRVCTAGAACAASDQLRDACPSWAQGTSRHAPSPHGTHTSQKIAVAGAVAA